MNFRQFLEIADFVDRDLANIVINRKEDEEDEEDDGEEKDDVVFVRYFTVDGQRFEIKLSQDIDGLFDHEFVRKLSYNGRDVEKYFRHVYYVSLYGPKGYVTTNTNRGYAEVYSQLLMTLRKFKEDYGLDGLVFTPAEKKMSLVYDRFIRNFTDFQVVDAREGIYLSRALMERIIRDHPSMSNFIAQNVVDYGQNLQKEKQKKVYARKDNVIIRGMIGKAILFHYRGDEWKVGIVDGIQRDNILKVWYYHTTSGMSIEFPSFSEIELISASMMPMYEKFLSDMGDKLGSIPGDHRPYVGALPGRWDGV